MLPIRVINTGAARALKHVTDKGLRILPWIEAFEAFAFDLEAARDVFTAHVRREVRPRVEALAKNRHFFAAEAIEAIFMQLFLLEVRKRTDIPSIIWLHDGLWIGREVDDQILHAAESHVRRLLFPHSDLTSSLFSIVDLHEAWAGCRLHLPTPPSPSIVCQIAIKGPDEVGVEGRSLDNSLLSNLAIDKLLSASSPATLTGLASVPELVGANTADLPNKGENPLECTLCNCLFLDLRLDSGGLPLSHTQWFDSLLSGNVLNIIIERCYLFTPPLACTAALYDQGCYWHLLCASFSFGDALPSLR